MRIQRRGARPTADLVLAGTTALLVVAPAFAACLWPATWVALVPLFLALRRASPRRAFLLGWWTETLIIWSAFYWLLGTMVRFGDISLPLSLLCFAAIGIGTGVRFGLFTWWVRSTVPSASPWWYRLLLPACAYVALDYWFPRVFPWYLGATQWAATPLVQLADVTGVHGITFLLVTSSTAIAARISAESNEERVGCRPMALALVALVAANLVYGLWRMRRVETAMHEAPSVRLALIQPNIGIEEKDRADMRAANLRRQVELSVATLGERPDLIIWPESMYPDIVAREARRVSVPPAADGERTPYWLLGALTREGNGRALRIFNSALLVGPDARVLGRYDKQHLLAFGEYVPFRRELPFLADVSPAMHDLTPGAGRVLTLETGLSIGPLICYEDIFPELARRAIREGATVLVNITNDAWFGTTRAPYLHRLLAAFRAIENRVDLVRVTNTGLTSVVDAIGREQVVLPTDRPDAVVHTVHPLRLMTVYTRFGDWFALSCSVAAVLLPAWRWRGTRRDRRRRTHR